MPNDDMNSKSVNASKRKVGSKTVGQEKPVIERILRRGTLAVAAVSMFMAVSPAEAQLIIYNPPVETNTISLGTASINLSWQPESGGSNGTIGNDGGLWNINGSQSYNAFNPAFGTLNSVNVSLTVAYNITDSIHNYAPSGGTYQGQDFISLSPIISSPFFSGSTYTNVAQIGASGQIEASVVQPGNSIGEPAAVFSYDYGNNWPNWNSQSQTGTLTYNWVFTSPSDMQNFLRSGTISSGVANASTPPPDAPFQVIQEASGIFCGSFVNLGETLTGTVSYVFAPYTRPDLDQLVPSNISTNLAFVNYFLDLGSAAVGSTNYGVLTLTNISTQPAIVSQVVGFEGEMNYVGSTNSMMGTLNFKISGVNNGDTLPVGGSENINVMFVPPTNSPTLYGRAGKLILYQPDGSTVSAALHGVGVTP